MTEKPNFIDKIVGEITLGSKLSFTVTYQAVITMCLVQFPAVCLAVLGIIKAVQKIGQTIDPDDSNPEPRVYNKTDATKSSLRASLVLLIPFFRYQQRHRAGRPDLGSQVSYRPETNTK